MSAEAIIKAQARDTLRHNYVKAIVALLIVLLPVYMIDGAATVIACALYNCISNKGVADVWATAICYPLMLTAGILLSPVINGYIRAYYKAAYTKRFDLNDVFYYFDAYRYKTALKLNISYILRMLIPVLVLYIPLFIYEITSANIGGDFYGSTVYKDFFFFLAVLSTITTTLYSLKYFTVFTICVDIETLDAKQAFMYSKYIMKNKTTSAAKLIFSFTPWMLLCLLVLPMLYVIPYMTQALCISAKWMTQATFEVN